MSLHHDEKREENIVDELEGLAQSKPSILAGDDEGDYTVISSTSHSLNHTNIAVEENILENGNDIVNELTNEEIALKEEEINEGNALTTYFLLLTHSRSLLQ